MMSCSIRIGINAAVNGTCTRHSLIGSSFRAKRCSESTGSPFHCRCVPLDDGQLMFLTTPFRAGNAYAVAAGSYGRASAEAADHVGDRVFLPWRRRDSMPSGGEQGVGFTPNTGCARSPPLGQFPYDHAVIFTSDRGVRAPANGRESAYHARKRLVDDDGDWKHDDRQGIYES